MSRYPGRQHVLELAGGHGVAAGAHLGAPGAARVGEADLGLGFEEALARLMTEARGLSSCDLPLTVRGKSPRVSGDRPTAWTSQLNPCSRKEVRHA